MLSLWLCRSLILVEKAASLKLHRVPPSILGYSGHADALHASAAADMGPCDLPDCAVVDAYPGLQAYRQEAAVSRSESFRAGIRTNGFDDWSKSSRQPCRMFQRLHAPCGDRRSPRIARGQQRHGRKRSLPESGGGSAWLDQDGGRPRPECAGHREMAC